MLFVAAIAAVIILFVFAPSFSAGVKDFSSAALLAPVEAYHGLLQYFRSKNVLVESNKALQGRITELSLKIERFKDLKNENERLRGLLEFKGKFGFDTITAEIIARNPSDWVGSIMINKGRADGIRKNSALCSAKGLLGKVVEVGESTSSAILITNPNFKTGGIVRGSRIHGIVMGAGKGTLRMLYIPLDADVKKGSTVATSESSRIFPRGISIGEIVSVEKSKTGLYKYAVIRPFASPFDQEEVLCIR